MTDDPNEYVAILNRRGRILWYGKRSDSLLVTREQLDRAEARGPWRAFAGFALILAALAMLLLHVVGVI